MRCLVAAGAPINQDWKSFTQPLLNFGELGLARQSIDLYVAANPGSAEARFEQALIYARTARAADAYGILGDLPRSVSDPAGSAYLRGTIAPQPGADGRGAASRARRASTTSDLGPDTPDLVDTLIGGGHARHRRHVPRC